MILGIWDILLIFGIIIIINSFFLYKQTKTTSEIYSELRSKGEMIVGQKRFFIFIITYYVAFAIDKNGKVVDAIKISGVLPFQKVKIENLPYKRQNLRKLKVDDPKVDFDTQVIVRGMLKKHFR